MKQGNADARVDAVPVLQFTQLIGATAHGARLARQLVVRHLAEWGWPPDSPGSEAAALVVAELAANAVTHGRVRGRAFRLAVAVEPVDTLRIEVADARGERRPCSRIASDLTAESGRGLSVVGALAVQWGSAPWPPSGKAVWAMIDLSCPGG
ncbi:ATP-binding protein [Streptomyces sp. CRN 30]|uniref:ATP-binding protein n=1 Tax=Streptomyces sp. CRN 30 TaxID=3075613 RepID=UPI002A83C30A|nr:ATP-binding protein [Streptomyces sp. CRN 30]